MDALPSQSIHRSQIKLVMLHRICRIDNFETTDAYTLRINFDDGTEQVVNFEPVLHGDLYRPLRHLAFFNQVALDQEVHTLVWPNGADFDPATLYDWPQNKVAFIEMASRWETFRT